MHLPCKEAYESANLFGSTIFLRGSRPLSTLEPNEPNQTREALCDGIAPRHRREPPGWGNRGRCHGSSRVAWRKEQPSKCSRAGSVMGIEEDTNRPPGTDPSPRAATIFVRLTQQQSCRPTRGQSGVRVPHRTPSSLLRSSEQSRTLDSYPRGRRRAPGRSNHFGGDGTSSCVFLPGK